MGLKACFLSQDPIVRILGLFEENCLSRPDKSFKQPILTACNKHFRQNVRDSRIFPSELRTIRKILGLRVRFRFSRPNISLSGSPNAKTEIETRRAVVMTFAMQRLLHVLGLVPRKPLTQVIEPPLYFSSFCGILEQRRCS